MRVHLRRPSGPEEGPQLRGGGKAPGRRAVVGRPPPGDGQGLHARRQGPQIFHPQVVVWAGQAVGPHRRLPGRREGQPTGQPGLQPLRVVRTIQSRRRRPQGRQFPRLTAEGEHVHHPRGGQQAHRPPGKGLRRRHGPGSGQLQHQIRPAGEGQGRPAPLVREGALPPLDPVAAHDAHHRRVRPQGPPRPGDVPGVSPVEGVVFCDDSGCGHGLNLQTRE